MKTFTNIDEFKAHASSFGSTVKIVTSHEEEPFIEYIASIDGKTCGFFADAGNFDGDETDNFGHHAEIETKRNDIDRINSHRDEFSVIWFGNH